MQDQSGAEAVDSLSGQISIFDLQPRGNFQLKGKLLRIEGGQRIVSYDFYCSACGRELFHNGEMMRKTKSCRFCGAELSESANFKRMFDM